ncbi:MAG TPA: SDR family oxidoreductase [Myxococcales bacterium]|nr:SDR family oxidoreductase [Myxococcales bacterium]HIN86073.1 SDR family oxidoreductase [Myxococcales bacterium]
MSTYLITGGAGFIGSNLVDALVQRGDEVRVIDDLSSGSLGNLTQVIDSIEFHKGDIRDSGLIERLLQGCDYVLHSAAIPSVARSVKDPELTHDVNVNGTLSLFRQAQKAKIKRVVFAGSSAVYGNTEVLPKVEEMRPTPLSPYAAHKMCGEYYARLFSELYALDVVTLRYFNVFGPRQDPKGDYAAVIPKFVARMMAGKPPIIYGDGSQTRDFCYIDNVVAANLAALTAPKAAGGVYNIACASRHSLLDLVALVNQYLGTQLVPVFEDIRPGDVLHSVAGIEAARRDLGYEPQVAFADGLRSTVAWYRRSK